MRLFEGTQFDRPPVCHECGQLEQECTCPPAPAVVTPPEKQQARVQLEKRKKGKSVTVIRGLDPDRQHLQDLLTYLKDQCGAGGTIQDDAIEIQGKHLERVARLVGIQTLPGPYALRLESGS